MWLPYESNGNEVLPHETDASETYQSVGEEIQRLSVVLNLPFLLESEEAACLNRVVPKVQLALPSGSTEFHMAASSAFRTILERKLVSSRTFTQTFLQSILSCIDNRDQVVANAWLETLLDVIDMLPVDTIKSDIFPLAAQKAALAQRVASKLVACRLLGRMCLRLDPPANRTLALPLVLSLCQDVKAEVRACVAQQLPAVARGLGSEAVKPALLPSVVELAGDEDSEVRRCTVEALVRLMPHLQGDTLKHAVAPLARKLAEQSLRAEDVVMVTMAKVFGELCLNLEPVLTSPEKKWLVSHYVAMSQLGLRQHHPSRGARDFRVMADLGLRGSGDKHSSCRLNCAFNFPAMLLFARSADMTDMLFDTLTELTADPYFAVRKTMASGLHEVARLLGPGNAIARVELVRLLKDVEEEVLNGLVPNLATTLTTLLPPDTPDNVAAEVGRGLLKCEGLVAEGNDWRLHQLLLQQFEVVPLVAPSDFVNLHVTPVVFARVVTARQIPVRYAAARALLQNLRYNTRANQRQDLRTRIVTDLCLGRSCYHRMTFLKLCGFALDVFSRKYFKEYLFQPLVDRISAGEVVANNRLVFVRLLPRLKSIMRLPTDKKLLVALEMAIRKLLSSERDRDVNAALKLAIMQLDKIIVPSEAGGDKLEGEEARRIEEETRIASIKMDMRPAPGSRAPLAASPPQRGLEGQPQRTMSSRSGQLATIDSNRNRMANSANSSAGSSPATSVGNLGGRGSSAGSRLPPGSNQSQGPWTPRPGSASKAEPPGKVSQEDQPTYHSGIVTLSTLKTSPFTNDIRPTELSTNKNCPAELSTNESCPAELSTNKNCPAELSTNESCATELSTNESCATELSTNKNCPAELSTNKNCPAELSTNESCPAELSTNESCATELSTNKNCPTELSTNESCPAELSTNESCSTELSTKKICPTELSTNESCPTELSTNKSCSTELSTKKNCPAELSTNESCPAELSTNKSCSTELSTNKICPTELSTNKSCSTELTTNESCPTELSTNGKASLTGSSKGRFGYITGGSPRSGRPRSMDFNTTSSSRLPVRKKL